jgi:hypothetical protein
VEFIKKNMRLDKKEADLEDSKTVVRICTQYAQTGMVNIFIALMTITLAFAFFDPNFFVAYLVSIAVFGLFQAIYMANAGGGWYNAKKLVEVDLMRRERIARRNRRRRYRRRSVQDTTSVAPNRSSSFNAFGLVVEIAVGMRRLPPPTAPRIMGYTSASMLAIALVRVLVLRHANSREGIGRWRRSISYFTPLLLGRAADWSLGELRRRRLSIVCRMPISGRSQSRRRA